MKENKFYYYPEMVGTAIFILGRALGGLDGVARGCLGAFPVGGGEEVRGHFDDCPTGAVALPRSRAGSWVSLDRPSGRGVQPPPPPLRWRRCRRLPLPHRQTPTRLGRPRSRLPFLSRPLCPVGRRVHLGSRLENNRQDKGQSTNSKKTNEEKQDLSREHRDIPGPRRMSCRVELPSWLLGGCPCFL